MAGTRSARFCSPLAPREESGRRRHGNRFTQSRVSAFLSRSERAAQSLILLLLRFQILKKRQRLVLLHAGAGDGGPAADQARAGFDLVDVDAANELALLARHGPACRERL